MSSDVKNRFDLSGRTALVTGSCESIGKAIALALAEYGASVIIHGKEERYRCEEIVREVKKSGASAQCCVGDLTREEDVEKIKEEIKFADVLVLNASVQIKKSFMQLTKDEFDTQMTANVWSALQLIDHYRVEMKRKKWGRILFIGSVQQVKPHSQMAVYAASKAAIANLTINLAGQFASDGITVNNLSPGVIKTGRNVEALSDKAYAEAVKKKIPAGYFGEPADCAGLALLLCTNAGRYITGQNIYCDGGMSL